MSSNTNYLQLANCESPKFLHVDGKKCLSSFIAYYFEIRWLLGSLFDDINKNVIHNHSFVDAYPSQIVLRNKSTAAVEAPSKKIR